MSEVRICNGKRVYCDGNCSLCNYTGTSSTTAWIPNSCEKLEPTLYGYNIKHLAFIARVMEEVGVTPEVAARQFMDISTMVTLAIEKMKIKMEEEIISGAFNKRSYRVEAKNERTD